MPEPAAYFISWSCYGQRLPGDPRGSVNDAHSKFGTEPLRPSPAYVAFAQGKLKHGPVSLSTTARVSVATTITEHCRIRNWAIHALNVRTTHVHIVVTCNKVTPEVAMVQLKSWATRRLREAGMFGGEVKAWTEHGSTRYLWRKTDVPRTVRYVLDAQDDGDRYQRAPWEL